MKRVEEYGWFVRRTDDVLGLAAFYRETIGLTQISSDPAFCVFWGGGTSVFEILPTQRPRPGPPTHRTEQAIVPSIACADIDSTIERLVNADVRFIENTSNASGRIVYFLDTCGQITGLVQLTTLEPGTGRSIPDALWRPRTVAIPDIAMHAADLGQICLITVHVADVVAETNFYESVVGLSVVGELADDRGVLLSIGDGVLLNLAPCGHPEPLQSDRSEADNMWMLQARDLHGCMAAFRQQGVRVINEPFSSASETVAYIADPEGHIIGINDGAGPDDGHPVRAETNRRWHELQRGSEQPAT